MTEERFERDLRAVLADEAPDTVPVTLRASLPHVIAGTGDRLADRPGALQRVGPMLATLASFALVGLVVATVVFSGTGRAPGVGGPGDASPGAPSPAFDREQPEGCPPAGEAAASDDGGLPEPEPGVVRDIDLTDMTPEEAAEWVAERDLCVSWRFYYRTDDNNQGYSEIWCTPPQGEIIAAYSDERVVTVMVRPLGNPILPARPQPPSGWGCD